MATVALLGLRLGLRPIGDNSALVHLRTGIDIVDGLGIPRADPYSFSASGEPWVVQSWFASVVYGVLHATGGFGAVVFLHGLLYGALAWLIATLARTGSPARTAAAAIIAGGVGVSQWSPRPLAVGLLAFAALVFVVRRGAPPLLLVPIVWVWVNSHGSFVLGALWLALTVAVDRRARRYAVAFALGLVAACANPLGPRLLTFPVTLLEHRANLARVIEWQPPSPDRPAAVVSLVALALAAAVVAARRPSIREVAPVVPFVVLGLVAQRNLGPAGIVLAPLLGTALRAGPASVRRPRIHVAFAAVVAVCGVAFAALAATRPALDLDGYPVAAAAALGPSDPERVVSTDIGGGYLIFREGRQAGVFVDDRYDMYPRAVIRDYLTLLDDSAAGLDVLERRSADAVIWPVAERELAAALDDDEGWRRVFADPEWVVYVRRAAAGSVR